DGEKSESARAAADIASLLAIDALEPAAQGLAPVTEITLPSAPVDVAALARALDGEHAETRALIRDFLADPHRRAYGLERDPYRALVRGWLADLASRGVGALAFPGVTSEAADVRPFMVAFETLAHGDLSLVVKLGVQYGLFGGSIYHLGTERHRAMLPDVASLALPGCFAMSEVGHGSNVSDLETVARYDHDTRELVVHTPRESARKEWIGGAARDARMATVFAQLEVAGERHGVHAVLVPIRDEAGNDLPGVRTGDTGMKMGLHGVDNGRLWFDQVRVPVANLLDRFARIDEDGRYESPITSPGKRFFTMLGTLVGGRLSVASASVSAAATALTIAIRYATARRQFGPAEGREVPLLAYPTHQRRLLPALATTYVLRLALDRLRDRFAEVHREPDPDTRELDAEVAALKALATWRSVDAVQQCREACGGQGYLAVNRIPDLRVDVEIFTTFEGDNIVLLQLVAKSLLSRFGKRLEDGGVGAMLRMVGSIAATAAREKNPIARRTTDRAHLRDRAFHRAALSYREHTLVRTAALRVRKRLGSGERAGDAMLELQEHFVAAARAYAEHRAMVLFDEALSRVADAGARDWITKLGDLHALSGLERDMSWYLEDGYIDAVKAKAIRKEVESLLRELTPAARSLVDAFAIPDECLAAPIAFFDPAHPPLS
ncbi:MAG: acyl-CoA dehydrogenase family protein, partial [Myxococcota bacterium]|nr:acyl-CoA dehydrogenase family protein [Myxococcota bacterium]